MIEISIIKQIFVILVNLFGIWLILWVYFAGRKNKVNQLFSVLTFFILIWVTLGYISNFPDQIHYALLWKRLIFSTVSLFFISAYFFSVYFPQKKQIIYSIVIDKIVVGTGAILFFISLLTDLIIKDVQLKEWGTDVILGKGIYIFYILTFFLTFLVLFNLLKKYFILTKPEKLRIQYFLIGILIFAFANLIFNVIFPTFLNTFQYNWVGNYSTIFLLAFTAYAIVKQELFGIRVVLTSIFVSLIAILLLFDILFLTSEVLHQLFKSLILVIFLYFGYSLIKSVLNEIERRKQLEKLTLKLEKVNVRLKKLLEMKEEFLHITSHQLRTPLTAIRGMVSMWCEGDFKKLSQAKKDEIKKRIYLSTERLNNITNDMIDAMELEGGRLKHDFRPVSLVRIIQETIETFKTNFDKNNLYINFKHPKYLPEIQGEESYLRQVFMNLIDNAQKYTSKGGVEINLKKENNFLVCEITDTGIGISEEDKERLFKKFSRGQRAEQLHTSGTGLGLFIVKKIIEEHNGKIFVFSEGENKGTTFKVCLPIRKIKSL